MTEVPLRPVVVTCAVTGANVAVLKKHPALPITPQQIAEASLEAARAGAAVVHIHVREPDTGMPSNRPELYAEVVERIREQNETLILNITTGMVGTIVFDEASFPSPGRGTDLVQATERVAHVLPLRPDICTLDCGTINFREEVFVARLSDLRTMSSLIREAGIKPELEIFDLGGMSQALTLLNEGLIADPPLFQFCLGTASGAPATLPALQSMLSMLPAGAIWAAFGISRWQFPILAQALLLGGHVRVGLEDNIYLSAGQLATNEQLVEKAAGLIEMLGFRVATPAEARVALGLAT